MTEIFIKYLPKDQLLYELWKSAKKSKYFYYCPELIPNLTVEQAANDINHMLYSGRSLSLTTYYGKMMYINITNEMVDVNEYNIYNGDGVAEKIIQELKKQELNNTICTYYKFK